MADVNGPVLEETARDVQEKLEEQNVFLTHDPTRTILGQSGARVEVARARIEEKRRNAAFAAETQLEFERLNREAERQAAEAADWEVVEAARRYLEAEEKRKGQ